MINVSSSMNIIKIPSGMKINKEWRTENQKFIIAPTPDKINMDNSPRDIKTGLYEMNTFEDQLDATMA